MKELLILVTGNYFDAHILHTYKTNKAFYNAFLLEISKTDYNFKNR